MPTNAERTDTTRRALLDAGRELFAERGFAGVSVGEISARAGITTGPLYHHFGSKTGLFHAVYDELMANTANRIAQARRENQSPSLIADCELYLDACTDPTFFRITTDAPTVIGWDTILDDTQKLIAAALATAQEAGEIDASIKMPPLARMLAAALKEAGVMIATAPDAKRARAEASDAARRLITGLTAERS
jgi:AcrR family transcriptional regulator